VVLRQDYFPVQYAVQSSSGGEILLITQNPKQANQFAARMTMQRKKCFVVNTIKTPADLAYARSLMAHFKFVNRGLSTLEVFP
jgi:hypothetical protein